MLNYVAFTGECGAPGTGRIAPSAQRATLGKAIMPRVCQIGRVFRRCHRPPVAVCQYCGRDFCGLHTGVRAGEDEICARPICREKHDDLKAHLAYRDAATERSNRGFCGFPECVQPRSGQCSKCHALFCDAHLQDREETFRQGMAQLKRPVCVCDHCAARIKLWAKT